MAHEQQPEGDAPHDILAAEEFVVPAPDPALHEEPVHDVLAAEEFAVPAPPEAAPSEPTGSAPGQWPPRVAIAAAAALLVLGVAAKLRRRG